MSATSQQAAEILTGRETREDKAARLEADTKAAEMVLRGQINSDRSTSEGSAATRVQAARLIESLHYTPKER